MCHCYSPLAFAGWLRSQPAVLERTMFSWKVTWRHLSSTLAVATSSFYCYTCIADNNEQNTKNRYSAVVIGAGWSGLGVAAALSANHVTDYLVLEKGDCAGYFWSRLYDNIRMNTFQHRLWHSPTNIEPNGEVQDYRDKHNVLQYLQNYAKHHRVDDHIRFNSEVQRVEYDRDQNEWIVHLENAQQIRTPFLTVATSINCTPHVPAFANMDRFKGTMLHTFDYHNAQQFDDEVETQQHGKRKFLVIGCGNSAIEIAGEIKRHNEELNDVTLLVRNGRHFTKESTKHRFEKTLNKICSPSPFSEESLMNDNMVSCNDLSFHTDIIQFERFTDFMIFTNMSKYGIPKPRLSPTADHYYNKKLTIVDRNTIPLIRQKKVRVVSDKRIQQFTEHGVQFEDGSEEQFDVVIFGTGYRHNLDALFGDELWQELSTNDYHYPDGLMQVCKEQKVDIPLQRAYAWPDLNGRSRSRVHDNLYFAGFDQGYLGGLTIGIYSWAIGEEIAVKLNKISVDKCSIPWIKKETLRDS